MAIRAKKTKKKKSLSRTHNRNYFANQFRKKIESLELNAGNNFTFKTLEDGEQTEEKMSAVILDFIKPFEEPVEDAEGFRRLITLASTAWNVAVMRQQGKPDGLDELLAQEIMGEEFRLMSRALIEIMVTQKLEVERFARDKRLIFNYQLSETRSGYHLSVASLPTT